MSQNDLTGLGEINALLGAGTAYEGKLVFDGRVRIDGEFVGEIYGDDVLVLGKTAVVRARLEVGTLIVYGGTVEGDIVATQLVEIHAPGVVRGNLTTPRLFIDKGVVFEGACTMSGGPSEVHEMSAEASLVERINESLHDAPAFSPNDEGAPEGETADQEAVHASDDTGEPSKQAPPPPAGEEAASDGSVAAPEG